MNVRYAAWSGQFYPASAELLNQEILSFLDMAPTEELKGRIVGIISPHAGYTYSGRTAAAAYKHIRGAFYKTVVVFAPSHSALIHGISAYDGDFYESPLGRIPVDKVRLRRLVDVEDIIHFGNEGHDPNADRAEHSLEVQLPMLQTVIDNFELVPLVFHDYSWENCRKLGEAVAAVFDPKETLIVASTDLYHGRSQQECEASDKATLNGIENDDALDFCFGAASEKYMACGAGPVAALKVVGEKWNLHAPRVIAQTNSAKITGAASGYVVGYAAAIMEEKEQDE